MTNVALVSRILLGLIFVAAGISGFVFISNPPPGPPGLATDFMNVFFSSRWVLFVDGAQLIAGVLLLANRYVAFALVVCAAIIYNMYVFHITMMPIGIFGPLVLTALWIAIATRHRDALLPLLDARA